MLETVETLTGPETWPAWCHQMELILDQFDLLEYVDGTCPKPGAIAQGSPIPVCEENVPSTAAQAAKPTQEEIKQWARRDHLAIVIIHQTISGDVL